MIKFGIKIIKKSEYSKTHKLSKEIVSKHNKKQYKKIETKY